MRVSEALAIIHQTRSDAAPYQVVLACGITPQHLKTFLHAHLQQGLPQRKVSVSEGLFGDLAGTLERAAAGPLQGIAVALEWPDLDPRLGYRSTSPWTADTIPDILTCAEAMLQRLAAALAALPAETRVALALPTLPLTPLFQTLGRRSSTHEVQLDALLAAFSASLATRPGTDLVNARQLAEASPAASRYDFKSDLLIGFPYTAAHADALAATLAQLLAPPAPKKGIITDLDDTVWNGLVGEIGPDQVSWDFSSHHHLHALYQSLLSTLAERGTLVGVASKNDAHIAQQALNRADILLPASRVFPLEIHWQAKSASVDRILKTWNIAADSVIFVDDSPLELAEVAAAHPGITCLQFPKQDYPAGLALLQQIRDLCGRKTVSAEDTLRMESIRSGAQFKEQLSGGAGASSDAFLESLDATVAIQFSPPPEDTRVLELVNKTNQFNLNGLRRSEADWQQQNQQPGAVVAVISYQDKFGPLGKIAVLQGQREGSALHLETWVMSCRAFSRRIEHQCLETLFQRYQLDRITFHFIPTPKNGPTQEFLATVLGQPQHQPLASPPDGGWVLTRQMFTQHCPALAHQVTISES